MTVRFTRSDYDRLPEGFRAQLIDGALLKDEAPTYGHQALVMRLLLMLASRVDPARVVPAPSDVGIDEFNVYQPDVLVLRTLPPDDVSDVGIPLLAIEVLSPSTARRDRGVKRRRLLKAGVEEVWLVDRKSRTVERHDVMGACVVSGNEILESNAVPGFSISPARLFGPTST